MTSPARAPRSAPRRSREGELRRPRPSLTVVPDPDRRASSSVSVAAPRRVRAGVVVAISTMVVFGALVVSAVAHSYLVAGQAELDEVSTEVREERDALAADRVELAANRSPQRIAAEALRLGMVPADTQTWVSPGTGAPPVVVGGDDAETPLVGDDEAPPSPSEGSSSELASPPPVEALP